MTSKRSTAIGVAAGVLGGAAIGAAVLGTPGFSNASSSPAAVVQQEDTGTDDTTTDDTTSDDTTSDDTTSDDTTSDDTTSDDTTSDDAADVDRAAEMTARLREELQALVDDGTISAEQADAVAQHLVENRPERGPGGGHHGRGGGPGFDGEVLSGLLGIDVEELLDQLRDGATISELATANGVDVQAVIDALVAEAQDHLALAVENGRLTQEEADEKLADVTERITEFVNEGWPGGWRGGDGPMGD